MDKGGSIQQATGWMPSPLPALRAHPVAAGRFGARRRPVPAGHDWSHEVTAPRLNVHANGWMAPLLLDVEGALNRARGFTEDGVPVFVAYSAPGNPIGFRLPQAWQTTTPNPRYVEAWEPGMALCAVMGHGLDLVDIDPRNGADTSLDWLRDNLPHVYFTALTPSGGIHAFVKSLGVRSRDNVAPGIDIKAGVDGWGTALRSSHPRSESRRVTAWTGPTSGFAWTTRSWRRTDAGIRVTDPARCSRRSCGTCMPGTPRPQCPPGLAQGGRGPTFTAP
jgi:hypothetical protein